MGERIYRHGGCKFIKVDKLPQGARRLTDKVLRIKSERTGHVREVVGLKEDLGVFEAKILGQTQTFIVVPEGGADSEHPDHPNLTEVHPEGLDPGIYQVDPRTREIQGTRFGD